MTGASGGVAPVVIEARGIEKSFRVPLHRMDSLKERAQHPLAALQHRELKALTGVSFDVHKGEFFGIVGRNGSGKSTLLKILASIYAADAGRVRMAGRLAPFIELGVGFNPEMSARENVLLNGVLMGLTKREATERFDAVIEFAELEEFVDLKLKNYSSGMMVRLAFAVMVQADADIMLIDEVLAVGDAAFAQKCMDVFHERRAAGRTIVLVTHDMSAVPSLCDRAMMLEEGEQVYLGDPNETALRYLRTNFDGGGTSEDERGGMMVLDINTTVLESWLVGPDGERIDNAEQGVRLGLHVLLRAETDLDSPLFGITVSDAEGVVVFSFREPIGDFVEAGSRLRIAAEVDNPLLPGRYTVSGFVYRRGEAGGALQRVPLLDFVVYGTGEGPGVVAVDHEIRAAVER